MAPPPEHTLIKNPWIMCMQYVRILFSSFGEDFKGLVNLCMVMSQKAALLITRGIFR